MTTRPLYRELAALVEARLNCIKSGNTEWEERHGERIIDLCHEHLPHGSGLDHVVEVMVYDSKPDKLVISADFHHMDENGMYDGWSEHTIVITPSLAHNFNLRITGRDRNDIKEYLAEIFGYALEQEIEIN